MKLTKILYITQEITPYLPESEVASTCRFLSHSVQEAGREIRTFMPKFGCVNERRNQLHEVIRLSGMNIIIDDSDHPLIIKVASIQAAKMQVYFIDNEDFFQHRNTTSDENGEFKDNDERMIFYVRGVLETVKKLRWTPDIIHCHGWMTALTPLYVKTAFNSDPFFKNTKIVYSLYNDGFQDNFSERFAQKLKIEGVEDEHLQLILNKEVSFADLSKLAAEYSDGVVLGSEKIDDNILKYISEIKCPMLPYLPIEENSKLINDFYDKILE